MMQANQNSRPEEAFLAAFSHEVRGALTLLSGALCLLKTTDLSGQQQELTRKMERASEFLLSLSNNMLDLNKMKEGKTELYPSEFWLDDLIDDVDLLFRDKVLDKRLLWDCVRNYPSRLTVTADRTRLMQILTNLLNNACKFTEQGFIRLRITCYDSRELLFEVEDSGMGMSQQEQENLFREYYQANNTLTRQHIGSGLGLCLSQRLAQAMQGNLELISSPGRGSCFTLRVPLSSHHKVLANPA